MLKKSELHILYISGLRDACDPIRRGALRAWRFWGITAELVPMKWADGGTFEVKYARLNARVEALNAAGKKVVLIGESAGGGVAVNALADHPERYYRVMTVCGKNRGTESVSPDLYRNNPAFRTALLLADEKRPFISKEHRQAFVSIRPFYDSRVPITYTLLPGCRTVRLWSVGHGVSIALALTLYSPLLIHEARR